ncbi:hypothetical protein D3C87_21180 [compost metagenome]
MHYVIGNRYSKGKSVLKIFFNLDFQHEKLQNEDLSICVFLRKRTVVLRILLCSCWFFE